MVGAIVRVTAIAAVTPSGDDDSLATGSAGTPVSGWFTVDSVMVCFLLFIVDIVVTLGLSVDCFCALCLWDVGPLRTGGCLVLLEDAGMNSVCSSPSSPSFNLR